MNEVDCQGGRIASGLCAHAPGDHDRAGNIIGMVPMAIGMGKAANKTRPRPAVIGGLLFATFATLFFVPCVFSIIHGRRERRRMHGASGKQ